MTICLNLFLVSSLDIKVFYTEQHGWVFPNLLIVSQKLELCMKKKLNSIQSSSVASVQL